MWFLMLLLGYPLEINVKSTARSRGIGGVCVCVYMYIRSNRGLITKGTIGPQLLLQWRTIWSFVVGTIEENNRRSSDYTINKHVWRVPAF